MEKDMKYLVLFFALLTASLQTVTAERLSPLIVNGTEANPAEFPFYVALQVYNSTQKKWNHFCGGTFISTNSVLTAAHCVDTLNSSQKYRLHYIESSSNPNRYRAKRFYQTNVNLHPSYVGGPYFHHDVAVITFSNPLPYAYYSRIAWLPDAEITLQYSEQDLFTVIGKGSTSSFSGASSQLLKTEEDFDENSLFFVSSNVESGACFGDSGGGLFKKTKGKYYLYGIASHIYGPANDYCRYDGLSSMYYSNINNAVNYNFIKAKTEIQFTTSNGTQYEYFMDPRYNNSFVNDDWATMNKYCELKGYDEAASFQKYCMEDEDDYYKYESGRWVSKETGSKNQCYLITASVYCKTED